MSFTFPHEHLHALGENPGVLFPGTGRMMQTWSDHMITMAWCTSCTKLRDATSSQDHHHARWCAVTLSVESSSFAMIRGMANSKNGIRWCIYYNWNALAMVSDGESDGSKVSTSDWMCRMAAIRVYEIFRNELKLLQCVWRQLSSRCIFLNESKLDQWRGRAAMWRHQHCTATILQWIQTNPCQKCRMASAWKDSVMN